MANASLASLSKSCTFLEELMEQEAEKKEAEERAVKALAKSKRSAERGVPLAQRAVELAKLEDAAAGISVY